MLTCEWCLIWTREWEARIRQTRIPYLTLRKWPHSRKTVISCWFAQASYLHGRPQGWPSNGKRMDMVSGAYLRPLVNKTHAHLQPYLTIYRSLTFFFLPRVVQEATALQVWCDRRTLCLWSSGLKRLRQLTFQGSLPFICFPCGSRDQVDKGYGHCAIAREA